MKVHSNILIVYPCLSNLINRAARNNRRKPSEMKLSYCNYNNAYHMITKEITQIHVKYTLI